MNLSDVLIQMVAYCEGEVKIEIVYRDENNCHIGSKQLPVNRVKSNFDGHGVVFQIEHKNIQDMDLTKP